MVEASTTATSPAHEPAARPWTQAWIEALPIAPIWVGCLFAAGHLLIGALYFLVVVGAQNESAWTVFLGVLPVTTIFALVIAYSTAGLAYVRRGHETTLHKLAPALTCSEVERSDLQRDVLRFDMTGLRWSGLVAALFVMLATYFTTGVASRLGLAALLWILWQNAICFWLLIRTITHDLRVSRTFSRAAERYAEIEIFDLSPLSPLAGRGLQSSLLIVLAVSLFSLILGFGDISTLLPGFQVGTVLLAAVALLLPSLGVQRRIHAAKRLESDRLSSEIRLVRAQAAAAGESVRYPDEARLATLLTLRQQVEATREWPFDLGTLGRFLLFAVIGVGSWLGGAAVERLLDYLLG